MLNRIGRIRERNIKKKNSPIVSSDDESDEEGENYGKGKYMRVESGDSLNNGKYKAVCKLGYGHFACVWHCVDKNHSDREVAIKIQKSRRDYRESAEQEIQVLKKLDGDEANDICRLRASFTEHTENGRHICMVFDLMDTDLHGLISQSDGLSLDDSLEVCWHILRGLEHIHAKEFIHADIKPDNVLIGMNGVDSYSCKISDFGTCIPHSERREWSYIQTLNYRAPEVVMGNLWGYSIDVWSTGCTLFECFTGDEMFSSDTEGDLLVEIVETLGRFPHEMIDTAKHRKTFFDRKYRVKTDAALDPWPLRRVLLEKYNMQEQECECMALILDRMLRLNHKMRDTAATMLECVSVARVTKLYGAGTMEDVTED